MKVHFRCPACDSKGKEIPAQDERIFACMREGCRVMTYSAYSG